MMSVLPPRPRTSLAPLVLAFAIAAFHASCATSQRLTNVNHPSCGDAVRGAAQSLLTHYESPELSAVIADRALSELQKSSPTPARFTVGGPPSTHTFGFLIEVRHGTCVIVLQSATLSTIASSPYPQDATIGNTGNRGSAFERVLPTCVCGP
jgi:hypothetical protein